MSSLAQLPLGAWGEVVAVRGNHRQRLLDLGLVPGTRVRALRHSPLGDPTAYYIRGAVLALRKDQAKQVEIRPAREEDAWARQ
ncbi:MAG: FeoA family protein [Bacillota bacterium]